MVSRVGVTISNIEKSLPFDFAGRGFELYAGIGISPTGADSSLVLEVPTHSW